MSFKLKPSPFIDGVTPYRTPKTATPVDLRLNGNEGAGPPEKVLQAVLKAGIEAVRLYPDAAPLETQLASMLGIDAKRVVVTAGADDALARVLRAALAPGREVIMPLPTFEMMERYARLAGGELKAVPWLEGPLPIQSMIAEINPKTALIAVVTPNSPIGQVATRADIEALSKAAPDALLLVDLAYIDFADDDLTPFVLALPNAVITRTLSKAWGLAGLRVGWAAGPEEVIGWLRAAGQPYAVSSLSLAVAAKRLESGREDVGRFVGRVRQERDNLTDILRGLGVSLPRSEGNFVFARFKNVEWVRDSLAGLGISVRTFPGKQYLDDGMRITVPGEEAGFSRLVHALRTILAPEALLFDMDDTLADVTRSYRLATLATARAFGADISLADITVAKAAGNANNDWVLTQKLIRDKGIDASLDDVTRKFEDFYQGSQEKRGYKAEETLLCDRALLERLASRIPLGVVTGRPRRDAIEFLEAQRITDLFKVVITMEEGPLKPDPAPVRAALEILGASRAWMVGDTPDDIRAARSARVLPIGIVAPADDPEVAKDALIRAGAGRVLNTLFELEELLP